MRRMTLAALCVLVFSAIASQLAAESSGKAWLEKWKADNRQWRAYHLTSPVGEKLPLTKTLIADVLAPMGINVLIVEVNYGFPFASHPELNGRGLNKRQARELTDVCRKHGIRLIPLMNCLGHQSWGAKPGALLRAYPQFDETPSIPQDDKKIYCREWCPSHPEVNKVVFALLDELIDAFDADAMHVGMDEVFLIGDKNCARCQGKDVGELFAKVVNDLHEHLVTTKGVEMLLWSDRLLDASTMQYGKWEASATGSHRAIDRVPKDIIMCDWHYELPSQYRGLQQPYPSVQFFQEKGFRVLPATWKKPEAAVALIRASHQGATDRMLGILFTGWSNGSGGESLLAALHGEDTAGAGNIAKQMETARGIAATIRAGLKELAGSDNDHMGETRIGDVIRAVDVERMKKHLFYLAKDPLPYRKLNSTLPGHQKNTLYEADDYLAGKLESWGYRVEREGVQVQAFRRDSSKPKHLQYSPPMPEDPWYTAYNLYAEKKGRSHPEEIIIVFAHKDSQSWVDSPGTNDNAIGTVGVLEMACILAKHTPERTIRFLFCNEEHKPWTSVTAAQNAKNRGDKIIAAFNIDSPGGKTREETAAGKMTNVTLYTKPEGERLAQLMSEVNVRYGIGLEQRAVKRQHPGDDDGSFVRAGYPAAILNIGSWPYGDPNYHAEGDIPERCDVPNAAKTVQATLAAILTIDHEP